MRMRIALVVVGLAFATIAIGQEPASPRVKLRTQVAKLRAEVELMQIEHDVDVAMMKDWFGKSQATELTHTERVLADSAARLEKPIDEVRKEVEALKAEFFKEMDRAKARFLEKTISFNEKKLELADLEQRLSVSR